MNQLRYDPGDGNMEEVDDDDDDDDDDINNNNDDDGQADYSAAIDYNDYKDNVILITFIKIIVYSASMLQRQNCEESRRAVGERKPWRREGAMVCDFPV